MEALLAAETKHSFDSPEVQRWGRRIGPELGCLVFCPSYKAAGEEMGREKLQGSRAAPGLWGIPFGRERSTAGRGGFVPTLLPLCCPIAAPHTLSSLPFPLQEIPALRGRKPWWPCSVSATAPCLSSCRGA